MSFRIPKNYLILLYNFILKSNSVDLMVFNSTKDMDALKFTKRGKITFTYDKKKLRPYRYQHRSGNSYRYIKIEKLVNLLQNASAILIRKDEKPKNVNEFIEFFNSKGIPRPKLVSACIHCLQEHDRLTRLTDANSYSMFKKSVCRNCAILEVQAEFHKRGIPLTQSSRKYYNEVLNRTKSVDQVVSNLWEPLKTSNNGDTTIFDVIPADNSTPNVGIKKFLNQSGIKNALDDDLIQNWRRHKLDKLLPVQQLAIQSGLLQKQDMLVVAGTSSGKTFVGELAGLQGWKARNQKFVFVTPLVALSNQKYETFKKRYKSLGARVVLRVGRSKIKVDENDIIIPDGNFGRGDIIVATYEALDWIFRSGEWKTIGTIGTFVIDEIQLLGDDERGKVVDGLLARIKTLFPNCQIICLSATIGNAEGLADELSLKLVSYLKRPIPLERHLFMAKNDEERFDLISKLVKNETKVKSSTNFHGQTLVFTNTRLRVQKLASLLKTIGVRSAYYHAGMTYTKRKRVEIAFEEGSLDVVTTTAALGAGADFPISQVIFERPGMGARWITTAEYHQMAGRAGRYGFHDRGKAILMASPGEKIYPSQDKTEEQVAFELLTTDVEEIEGDIELEDESD
ncbi:MAG: DEAD/DEAH box helicase, partial [Candidatus Heimdallarchaeota archaeon]|nr:DEAD/DEAH box helicase [Candidatus Heimdallarchaeota archaeon]